MAILTANKLIKAVQGGTSHGTPQYWHYPHAATDSFQGSVMMLDIATGFVKVCPLAAAGTSAGVNPVVGIMRGSYPKGQPGNVSSDCDNSGGAAGDRIAIIEAGIFPIINDTTAGAVLGDEHLFQPCFMMDDNNVSANPLNYNRPFAGIFMGLDPDGLALVSMDPHRKHPEITIGYALANADLSTLQYTTVKLISDSGVGEYASQATDTGLVSGILLNAPTGVTKRAVVCTGGPCPAIAGAAGYVCGTELMVTTGGALIAATAAKVVVGQAMETATNGQTRMIRFVPRQLAA